jgi:DNA-directed RNA polymerase subunit K/omega
MSKKPISIKISKKSKKDDDEIDDLELETDKIDDVDDLEFNEEDSIDEDDNELDIEINDDEDSKICHIQKVIDDDNEYYDNDEEIEAQPDINIVYIKKEERQSLAKLTKYEMVRILGERTKQLTMGAKPLIKNYKGLPYDKISEEELKLNMIPFKIRRPLPNGKYELWNLEELSKEHLLSLLE